MCIYFIIFISLYFVITLLFNGQKLIFRQLLFSKVRFIHDIQNCNASSMRRQTEYSAHFRHRANAEKGTRGLGPSRMGRMIQGAGFLSTNSCRVVDVTEDRGKNPIDFQQKTSGEC